MLNLGKSFFLVMVLVMAMSELFISVPSKASAFTSSDADTAMNAFNTAYYRVTNGNGYFNKYSDGGTLQSDFWTEAEMIEVVEDAYDRSQNIAYKNQINELYNGFVNKWGSDWTNNTWNDDIIWITLANARAYQITGNVTYKNQAKYHFDAVYNRAYDTVLGGGLYETTAKQSKNACLNGPAIVAATKLYQMTGDAAYLDKAKSLYSWLKSKLVTSDGRVYDNIDLSGKVTDWNFSYNQGAYIGAGVALYKITNDATYLNDAIKSADYALAIMSGNVILYDFEGTSGDVGGFKGIFTRYMKMLIVDGGQTQYTSWMQQNANSAWNNRRTSDNLIYGKWGELAPGGALEAWASSSGVALLQNIPAGGAQGSNLLNNPGFETGNLTSWVQETQPALSGVETNSPHTGTYDAYLHPNSSSKVSIYQTITAPSTGTYTVSAYSAASTSTTQGFGVDVAGTTKVSIGVASGAYRLYTATFTATAGQAIKVWYYSQNSGWATIDDISLSTPNLLNNSGLETGNLTSWVQELQPALSGVETASPRSGTYDAYLHPNSSSKVSIYQTITAPRTATYTVYAYCSASSGTIQGFGVDVAGVTKASLNVSSGAYRLYSATFSATAGQEIKVWYYSQNSGWATIDDVSVTY